MRRTWLISLGLALAWSAADLSAALQQPASPTVAETYRQAYDQGYRDGRMEGYQDRRAKRVEELTSKAAYRNANAGLDERHDASVYQVAYRRGFKDGYQAGLEEDSPPPVPVAGRTLQVDLQPPPVPPDPTDSVIMRLPAGTEIRIELLETLSTKYNEREDPFHSQVIEPVQLGGRLVVPQGSRIDGTISYLKRAGRIRGRAQINLRFESLQLPDGRSIPIEAAIVAVEPRSPEQVSNEGTVVAGSSRGADTKRVGQSSAVGAVIGALGGGSQGAAVGAAAGAVAGLASVLVTRGRDAQLETRTQLTIRLMQEVQLPPKTNPDRAPSPEKSS